MEQGELFASLSETLPRKNRAVAPRPLLPTMIRFHCSFFASLTISFAMFPSFRIIFESTPCRVAVFFPLIRTLFPTFRSIFKYSCLSNKLRGVVFQLHTKALTEIGNFLPCHTHVKVLFLNILNRQEALKYSCIVIFSQNILQIVFI